MSSASSNGGVVLLVEDNDKNLKLARDVLEFAGVGVRRGTADLLHDITWSVEEGERWVVIGPNGFAESTSPLVRSRI